GAGGQLPAASMDRLMNALERVLRTMKVKQDGTAVILSFKVDKAAMDAFSDAFNDLGAQLAPPPARPPRGPGGKPIGQPPVGGPPVGAAPGGPGPGGEDPVSKVRQAAQRVQSQNNLKQIGLGIISHADANRGLMPANICDPKTGQPLLSWRVAILPYIGE